MIVESTGGTLRGERLSCGILCNYFSFKGIPYGKAPVGELRFRAPQPHEGWDGIREANEHTASCPQNGLLGPTEDEDCLSLNVYTQNTSGRSPVMVWIYGGAFSLGSGDSQVYGPDHIVQQGVTLVTMNYRLGALGFLSTGDEHAPGNYGMKDVILSLKWIQVCRRIICNEGKKKKIIFRITLLNSVVIPITVRQSNKIITENVAIGYGLQ